MNDLIHSEEAMTAGEILDAVNDLRLILQERTCCPDHAMEVALLCAATFALDFSTQPTLAARELEREARDVVSDVRSGRFTLQRQLDS